jgi:hypothetical protein
MITEKLRKTAFRECWSEQILEHGAQIADGIGGWCLHLGARDEVSRNLSAWLRSQK